MGFKYNVPAFLKRKDSSLLYAGTGEMFIYVPEVYFESGYAEEMGEFISLFGIVDFSINNNPDKPVYGKDVHNLYFPSVFLTTPYNTEKVKDLDIGGESIDYRILKYKTGDVVVNSVLVPKIVNNAEDFYKLLVITAKVPNTIKYGTFWKYFLRNIDLCGGNYKINATAFGMIESELCRDPSDLYKPFRLSSTFKTNKNGYKLLSIKEMPKYISPYTAITSENFDESIIAAVGNNKDVYTPLEKVLMS